MVTISKGLACIMDNRMGRISEKFALTLTYILDFFPADIEFLIQSHDLFHTGTFVQSEQD